MEEKEAKKGNKYVKLFAISSQFTSSVVGFAILGYFLDQYYEVERNYFTLGLTLLGVFVGLYLLMQGVKKLND